MNEYISSESKDLVLSELTKLSDLEVIKKLTKYRGIGN